MVCKCLIETQGFPIQKYSILISMPDIVWNFILPSSSKWTRHSFVKYVFELRKIKTTSVVGMALDK